MMLLEGPIAPRATAGYCIQPDTCSPGFRAIGLIGRPTPRNWGCWVRNPIDTALRQSTELSHALASAVDSAMMHASSLEIKIVRRKSQDPAARRIKMQALRDQGLSDRAIARAFGVSAERVAQILGRKMASHVEAARLKREHSGA